MYKVDNIEIGKYIGGLIIAGKYASDRQFVIAYIKLREAARRKCWLPLGKFACMLEEGIALKERNARSFLIGPLRNKDFVGDDDIRELCPVVNVVVTGDFS
jgi:hypothetical protein